MVFFYLLLTAPSPQTGSSPLQNYFSLLPQPGQPAGSTISCPSSQLPQPLHTHTPLSFRPNKPHHIVSFPADQAFPQQRRSRPYHIASALAQPPFTILPLSCSPRVRLSPSRLLSQPSTATATDHQESPLSPSPFLPARTRRSFVHQRRSASNNSPSSTAVGHQSCLPSSPKNRTAPLISSTADPSTTEKRKETKN